MKNWITLKKELLENELTTKEYKRLKPRYALISQLIKLRQKKGLSQKQLAAKIGTKQSAIARMESGKINPTFSFLEKITNAMDANFDIRISNL